MSGHYEQSIHSVLFSSKKDCLLVTQLWINASAHLQGTLSLCVLFNRLFSIHWQKIIIKWKLAESNFCSYHSTAPYQSFLGRLLCQLCEDIKVHAQIMLIFIIGF